MNKALLVAAALAALVAVATVGGAKPDLPECSDLLANMLVCSAIP